MLPNSQRRTSNPSTDQTENVAQNTERYEPRYIYLPHPTQEFKEIKPFLKKYNLPKVKESQYSIVITRLGFPNGGKINADRLPVLHNALRGI